MDIYDIVHKLTGQILPVGETSEDERRLENLKVVCELVNKLVREIEIVSMNKNKAGKYADTFMKDLDTWRCL